MAVFALISAILTGELTKKSLRGTNHPKKTVSCYEAENP